MKYNNKRINKRQIFSIKEPSKDAIWLDANDFKKKIYKNGQWVEVGGDTVEIQIEYVNQYFEDTIVQQTIQIDTGWNWIGLMVGTEEDTLSDQIVNPFNGMMIKNMSYVSTYEHDHWEGSLKRLEAGSAYMVYNTGEPFTLIIQGHLVNPISRNRDQQGGADPDIIIDQNGWLHFNVLHKIYINDAIIRYGNGQRLYNENKGILVHDSTQPDDDQAFTSLTQYINGRWTTNIELDPCIGYRYGVIQLGPIVPHI